MYSSESYILSRILSIESLFHRFSSAVMESEGEHSVLELVLSDIDLTKDDGKQLSYTLFYETETKGSVTFSVYGELI